MPTLLDIAKRNGHDAIAGIIEDAAKATPEVTGLNPENGQAVPGVGDGRTIRGLNFKTLVRSSVPTVPFRNANAGGSNVSCTWDNKLVETFIMNPRWYADRAVADRSEDGPEMMMADEAAGVMQGAVQQLGRSFYYGRANSATPYFGDALGFNGLVEVYDATNMVVDAGGTTASTGSSVWAVKFGHNAVRWIWGANGELVPTDVEIRDVDDASGNPFSAYFQEMFVYPGLQVSSTRVVARIKKLTADSGKGLTDTLMNQLLEKFPVGIRPDVIFMTKRSRRQLRDSRTATSESGREAAQPMDFDGVPIVVTESLVDTEALTL